MNTPTDDSQIISAAELEEGNQINNGLRYVVVEDVRPDGARIRVEADGYVLRFPPDRPLQVIR